MADPTTASDENNVAKPAVDPKSRVLFAATIRAATDIGLQFLTLYAFSSENWKRPPGEVRHLMGLFRAYFREDVDELVSRNVCMRIIGSRRRAEPDILAMIEDGEARTASNSGLHLTFAFDYGAQEEIAAAAREMENQVPGSGVSDGLHRERHRKQRSRAQNRARGSGQYAGSH